jgi:hypothetical protein
LPHKLSNFELEKHMEELQQCIDDCEFSWVADILEKHLVDYIKEYNKRNHD